MNKRIAILFTSVILMCAMILPVGATQQTYQETEIIHTEFGDIEKVSVVTVYNSVARSSTKSADCTDTYKYSGNVIAEVTLSATFGYDGKTSWVVSASGSNKTYDGWSYGSQSITKSGGTASLSAKLSHLLWRSVNVNMSLTCSPSGQIS